MRALAACDITGVILAGGQGRRLGGADKGLVPLHGRPLIEHVIAGLQPQVGSLLISANRHREIYAAYGFRVVTDVVGDYAGPLAGMLSAMRVVTTPFILTAPCDAPNLPTDLAARLGAALARANAAAAVAVSGGQMQPVFALLSTGLAETMQQFLEAGDRGVGAWLRRQQAVTVEFPGSATFWNINTEEDLRRAQGREGSGA